MESAYERSYSSCQLRPKHRPAGSASLSWPGSGSIRCLASRRQSATPTRV